jgi:hypothetical protein
MKALHRNTGSRLRQPSNLTRLFIGFGLIALHNICNGVVNRMTSLRPVSDLLNVQTPIDQAIPYLSWTWVFYISAVLVVILAGMIVVWNMPKKQFYITVLSYSLMFIIAALVQYLLPIKSPWPENMNKVQGWYHHHVMIYPYACLPSMHVALIVFPILIAISGVARKWIKVTLSVMAIPFIVSTLTLKEHYFVDVLAGILLAVLAYRFWKSKSRGFTENMS